MDPSAPGWYPDPSGRHERRYWSGIRWSRHVEDGGVRDEDQWEGRGAVATAPSTAPVPVVAGPPRRPVDQEWELARRDSGSFWSGASTTASGRPGATGEPGRPAGGRRRLLVAAVAATVVVLGAAVFLVGRGGDDGDGGGGSGGEADGDLRSVLVQDSIDNSGGTITDEEAGCMADAVLSTVGEERLVALGVLDGADPTLSADDAEKEEFIPLAMDCLDDEAFLVFMQETAATYLPDAAPEMSSCVIDGWFRGLGRERLEYLYARLARIEPPPLEEILNANEVDMATRVIGDCQTTPAPPPG